MSLASFPDRSKSIKRPLITLQEIGEKYRLDEKELHSLYASDGWPKPIQKFNRPHYKMRTYYDPKEIYEFLQKKGKV